MREFSPLQQLLKVIMELSLLEQSLVVHFGDNPQDALKLSYQERIELAAITFAFYQTNTGSSTEQMIEFIDGLFAEQVNAMNQLHPTAAKDAGIPESSEERIEIMRAYAQDAGDNEREFFMNMGELLVTQATYIDLLKIEQKNA